jgi:hypothetical protein
MLEQQRDIMNAQVTDVSATSEHEIVLTVDYVKAMIEQAKNEIRDQTKNDIRNETKEIEKQVLVERASLITVFGLFASITSFLVIEFQCLKTVSTMWGIVGFSCVICSLLLSFNIGLDYLIKSRFDTKIPRLHWFYTGFIVLLFIIGCVSIYRGECDTVLSRSNTMIVAPVASEL